MIVGDTGVGKTCALEMFTNKNILSEISPTVNLMKYQTEMAIDNETVSLEIWDTPGEDSFKSIRKSCYPLTDVVLLVFSMVNRQSLDNVKLKLFLEVKDETKNVSNVYVLPSHSISFSCHECNSPCDKHYSCCINRYKLLIFVNSESSYN